MFYIVNFLECKKNWDKKSKINVNFLLEKTWQFLERLQMEMVFFHCFDI